MKRRYLVVYEKTPNNYGAHAPDVPGCASLGVSLEETRELIQEGLRFHLESMVESGEQLPATVTTAFDFAEEVPEHGIECCIVEWLEIEIPTAINQPVLSAVS